MTEQPQSIVLGYLPEDKLPGRRRDAADIPKKL